MENKKQMGSSSSFANDLFGAKESSQPSGSSGSFSAIFPPPSKVPGRNSTSGFMGSMQKESFVNQSWSSGNQGDMVKNREGANMVINKGRSSIFQEKSEPCPLSSSLYYGGQEDMYGQSSSAPATGSYSNFKKHGEEDDPNGNNSQGASRGNWWQGSLYY